MNSHMVIIGSGPTGLTLGINLLHSGIKEVLIVEKREGNQPFSKALLVNSDTLQLLKPYDVDFSHVGRPIDALSFNTSYSSTRIAFDTSINSYNSIILPQVETESVLLAKFEEKGGRILKGYCFNVDSYVKSETEEYKYKVTLKKANSDTCDTDLTINCNWIFGCDGYHSNVRRSLNIPFSGYSFHQKAYAVDVEIFEGQQFPFPSVINMWLSAKGFRAAFQLSDNRIRLIAATKQMCFDSFQFKIKEIIFESEFPINFNLAKSYHSELHDNIWLAGQGINTKSSLLFNMAKLGDAAHAFSPVGGRGMNMGIADAVMLAKCVVTNDLDQYEKTRRPIALRWILVNSIVTTIMLRQAIFFIGIRLFLSIIFDCMLMIFGNQFIGNIFAALTSTDFKIKKKI